MKTGAQICKQFTVRRRSENTKTDIISNFIRAGCEARLEIHGSKIAKCYRHLSFATGLWVVGTVVIFCYLSCKLLVLYYRPDPANIRLLVRLITTYGDNAIRFVLKICYHKNSFPTSSQNFTAVNFDEF